MIPPIGVYITPYPLSLASSRSAEGVLKSHACQNAVHIYPIMAGDRPSALSANLFCLLIERLQLTGLEDICPVKRHRGRGVLFLGSGGRFPESIRGVK